MQVDELENAIKLCGIYRIAADLGLTYQAVHKWRSAGFPRSEWTGETCYALKIEALSESKISAQRLLEQSKQKKANAVVAPIRAAA